MIRFGMWTTRTAPPPVAQRQGGGIGSGPAATARRLRRWRRRRRWSSASGCQIQVCLRAAQQGGQGGISGPPAGQASRNHPTVWQRRLASEQRARPVGRAASRCGNEGYCGRDVLCRATRPGKIRVPRRIARESRRRRRPAAGLRQPGPSGRGHAPRRNRRFEFRDTTPALFELIAWGSQ
jgi:hypothetical protein